MTFLYILLGILPSVVWLSIYLKEDEHPEPNKFVLWVFFLGALAAPIAAGIEYLLIEAFNLLPIAAFLTNLLIFFVAIALTEEFWKYAMVKISVVRKKAFDEPADAMIYLIVAALGFAAVENILAIFTFTSTTNGAFEITILRFLSATLLHVLASAIVGYYLARDHFFLAKSKTLWGIAVATFLHGLYNILTLASDGFENLLVTIYIVLLLGFMAVGVNILFYKLKKDYYK